MTISGFHRLHGRGTAGLLLAGVIAAAGCRSPRAAPTATPTYAAIAVRFATLPAFRVRSLVAGADTSRRLDIAMTVWALRAPDGKTVLIDAGFHRDRFLAQWKPRDYVTPAAALERAEIRAGDVTDVIITHIHWDHADGVDLFPNARIWLQRQEYDYYVGPAGEALQPAIDRDVATALHTVRQQGRLRLVDQPDAEILPGIRVHTGGKHTFASQYVSVRTAAGIVVFASDNAYLYENLERQLPIAQTLDATSNLRAQARMLELAASPRLVVPGHDMQVFTRFPSLGDGIAAIR
jgi:glyoxylase-like metal-dependent hydrolase (beta-lactamase superfamily II)